MERDFSSREHDPTSSDSRPSPRRESDASREDMGPVPHDRTCEGREVRRGRLFILTSRRRGRAVMSGKEVEEIRGQWEKVSLERWIRVERSGIEVRLGECEMTDRSVVARWDERGFNTY